MNSIVQQIPAENISRYHSLPTSMAEQELKAFFNAVMQIFNKEQAELAAEDWIFELNQINEIPRSTAAWRSITARAANRLALRVNALSNNFSNA